jgi:Uma2 family endonuclease
MSTATDKLITAEEFFQMPEPADGSRQELVRGVIVTMPPPGGLHGACCSRINRRVGNYVDDQQLGTVCCNDTGFVSERDPDTVRGPDVSFWSRERLPVVPATYIEIPPDLVVEVVSPSDHYSRIQTKLRHYLSRGGAPRLGRGPGGSKCDRLPLATTGENPGRNGHADG